MSSRSVKILAIVVIVLFGVLFVLNTKDRRPLPRTEIDANDLIAPGLKDRLNEIDAVSVTSADARVSIVKDGDAWIVSEKGGYPAQVATLRQVLLAIADARKIEAKTSNPDLYDRLAVQHPGEDGGNGTLVSASSGEVSFALILGDVAQEDYRYARQPDETQSWLIDKNPPLPDELSEWLLPGIVDLDTARVQSVVIRHADDETIEILKETPDATAFEVKGVPAGRELSYPTVVNGIAGALDNLALDDVIPLPEKGLTATTTTTYTTFDGLQVVVSIGHVDEQTWMSIEAQAVDAALPGAATQAGADELVADRQGTEVGESSEPATAEVVDVPASDVQSRPEDEAAAINARTARWLYQVADYKSDQLARRWEDILQEESDD